MKEETNIYNTHLIVEKTVLAILIQNEALLFNHVLRIKPNYFHQQKYELVYSLMLELVKVNMPIDEPILLTLLQNSEPDLDWNYELAEIKVWQEKDVKLPYFIEKLEENYANRQLAAAAIQMSAVNKPFVDRINDAIQHLLALKKSLNYGEEKALSKLILNFLSEDQIAIQAAKSKTGIRGLDKAFNGGFDPKELVIVGGRPGMGKSAFLLGFCNNLIDQGGKKVLFVSLKLNPKHFLAMLLANKLNVPLHHLLNGQLPSGFDASSKALLEAENTGAFKFHYHMANDVIALMAEINNHKIRYGLDVVIIDGLQLLDGVNPLFYQNRNNVLGNNLRSLKQLAETLNFMLLISSDLSRSVERRMSSRPILSDLKDSGWIEELADKIIMIYRPEYYGYDEWEDGEATKGQGELIICKNNMGMIENIRVGYNPLNFKFSELLIDSINFDFGLDIPESRMDEFEKK